MTPQHTHATSADHLPDQALVPAGADPRGTTERIERMDHPTPGTYWRMRTEFAGRHDERIASNAIPKGRVLMLASI